MAIEHSFWWYSSSGTQAHQVLESLAYLLGARVYWWAARALPQPPTADRWLLLGSAIFGAMLGSKLLHILEHLPFLLARQDLALWLSGKSVLGGFLGGTIGVELAKRAVNWRRSTGDAWVPALAIGLMIGRLGCQLSGTWDQTYGIPTSLPWAWDYGDGIGRHPTGLYEILLVGAAFALTRRQGVRQANGVGFALFLTLYCVIRFVLEWFKPPFGATAIDAMPVTLYLGLTAIQWAAIVGLVFYGTMLKHRLARAFQ